MKTFAKIHIFLDNTVKKIVFFEYLDSTSAVYYRNIPCQSSIKICL
ncbi:hypothetical protein CCAND95_10056 [Capnocytophaga canis]|nr:hypothetical protein CCAND95_10056 [Capnocytophaga canis]